MRLGLYRSLIYDDITSFQNQHHHVTEPEARRSKVHVKLLWAWKVMVEFRGKQVGPGGWTRELGQRGNERRKRAKQILKYGHWHEQKFYPQHFPTCFGK